MPSKRERSKGAVRRATYFQTQYGSCVDDAMDASRVHRIREEMERADARRLQPHYTESFFLEASQRLGGTAKPRESRRYEVMHVPPPVRTATG